jgi:hypothetical protein
MVITNISLISPQIKGSCISPNSRGPPPTVTSLSWDARQRWFGGRWKMHLRKALLRRPWLSWTQGGGRCAPYIGGDYWWSVGTSLPIVWKNSIGDHQYHSIRDEVLVSCWRCSTHLPSSPDVLAQAVVSFLRWSSPWSPATQCFQIGRLIAISRPYRK